MAGQIEEFGDAALLAASSRLDGPWDTHGAHTAEPLPHPPISR